MNKKIVISPSILSCNFARVEEEIGSVKAAGCDWVHLDIMDGHFVPNLTIGPPVIKWIRKATDLPLDVHLMIETPAKTIAEYRDAGADMITFHVEAENEIEKTLSDIKKSGAKAGLSLRPRTLVDSLFPYLNQLDLILVMTVEPGFGGQAFMPEMLDKIAALRSRGFKGFISVDGGINDVTAKSAVSAGADVLVAGTAIFGKPDRKKAIESLRNI